MKRQGLRTTYFFAIIVLIFFSGLISCTPKASEKGEKSDERTNEEYDVAAYVWPSCHHDERFGDMLWPDGTGE